MKKGNTYWISLLGIYGQAGLIAIKIKYIHFVMPMNLKLVDHNTLIVISWSSFLLSGKRMIENPV